MDLAFSSVLFLLPPAHPPAGTLDLVRAAWLSGGESGCAGNGLCCINLLVPEAFPVVSLFPSRVSFLATCPASSPGRCWAAGVSDDAAASRGAASWLWVPLPCVPVASVAAGQTAGTELVGGADGGGAASLFLVSRLASICLFTPKLRLSVSEIPAQRRGTSQCPLNVRLLSCRGTRSPAAGSADSPQRAR